MKALERARQLMIRETAPPMDLSPSEWAEKHIKLLDGDRPGPLRFDRGYEFQRAILDEFFRPYYPGERRRVGVCFKGAQSGVTTLSQVGLLYLTEHRKISSFHLMPREFDAQDKAKKLNEMISADAALDESFPPGLMRVRKTRGGQTLRVAYSNSQAELKNWQAGAGVFDEVDELESRDFDSVAMAKMRMGAYRRRTELYIGTPTLPDFGIHRIWQESDQRKFLVPCPLCEELQELTWEGNITWENEEKTAELRAASAKFICAHCKEPWDHRLREMANAEGSWVKTYPERPIIGFGLSRLLVPSSLPGKMVSDYLAGLESDTAMREHVNQNLGNVYLPTTGQLTTHTIENAIDQELTWGAIPSDTVTLTAGVDVQGDQAPFEYFWEVRAYNSDGFAKVIAFGITKTSEELAGLFGRVGQPHRARYRIAAGLVDISDGHHKETVEALCELCPVLQPARFEWRMRGFERGKIVRLKKGKGFAINKDDALQDNIGRFFETPDRPRRIAIATCPQRALEAEWVEHYTKIARVRERTARGDVFTYRKLRQRNVDFPYAGALAEYAFRQRGGTIPGGGSYGSTKGIKERAEPGRKPDGSTAPRKVLRIVKRRSGGRRHY